MTRDRLFVVALIVVQVIAIMLYPRSFFQQFPQSVVLPTILLIILILTLIGIYSRVLSPLTGRISMVFVLGVNMVMRVITLFPNLKPENQPINSLFAGFTLLSIALSWWAVVQLEKKPLRPSSFR